MAALHSFNSYHHIWRMDREEAMGKYDKPDYSYIHVFLWLWRTDVLYFFVLQIYPR